MSRILITAMAASLCAPAIASAAPTTFSHDGVTYTYVMTKQGNTHLISGRTSTSGRYRLLVKNGRVTGHVDGRPVAFRTNAKLADDRLEIAGR